MKKLGTYQLGYRMVNVYLDPKSSDGECNLCQNAEHARIVIGTARGFHHAWSVLVHEAFELAMQDEDCSYTSTGLLQGYTQYFTFVMSHEQYTKIATATSFLLHDIFDDLKKAVPEEEKDLTGDAPNA